MMKLRVYSDLHLDHYGEDKWYPPVMSDDAETTLILAGDLWVGTNFISNLLVAPSTEIDQRAEVSWIETVAENFKQVLVVLGNHDYWPCNPYLTIKNGGQKCNDMILARGIKNVKVLDCDTYEDGDVLFVGCTLWTDMDKAEPLTMYNMQHFMAYDGKCAYDTGPSGAWSRFTSEKWVSTHYRHRDYLKLIFEQNRDKKIVVITHHLPLLNLSNPYFLNAAGNGYYMSDLSSLILDNEHIKYWFYGHTHYHKETQLGSTLLVNNCVGYKSQGFELQRLVTHKVIEV